MSEQQQPNVCDASQQFPGVCDRLEAEYDYEDRHYCVLHYPNAEKGNEFRAALDLKLQSDPINLSGIWVPPEHSDYFKNRTFDAPVSFVNATFAGIADFYHTVFRAPVVFSRTEFCREAFFSTKFCDTATFDHAIFQAQAQFRRAQFLAGAARFEQTRFCEVVSFKDARFLVGAGFRNAVFHKSAVFENTTFSDDVDLREVSFMGQALFKRTVTARETFNIEKQLDLRAVQLVGEGDIFFHTVTLRPAWFIDTNPQQFNFTGVKWHGLDSGWPLSGIKNEIKVVERLRVPRPHSLLEDACRGLAVNAEEHHLYEEASEFRYWSMDARRRTKRRSTSLFTFIFWYWLLSGYSERVVRAFLMLGVILIGFAALYLLFGYIQVPSNSAHRFIHAFWESLVYSLGALTRQNDKLANSDPLALRSLVIVEGIFGPLQIALLALALRRQFMRQ